VITTALGEVITSALGGPMRILAESSWLRRQRPPATAPAWHVPHSWHQDGALGADFTDVSADPRLRTMITAWCPLVACGSDAPGIGYVPGRRQSLLRPEELADVDGPVEAPVMHAGDVLLMMGDLLHRTHVDPAMTRERTSVEVRFVPGPPATDPSMTDHS
jgi:ectoine hydroxylase-related dioxygenase (phytanoyl-CoA dioxygenase family)